MIIFLIISIIAFYVILTLISFNPLDDNLLHVNNYHFIYNLGGIFGAWLSNVMFFIFGKIAYIITPIILLFYWNIHTQQNKGGNLNYFIISGELIGIIMFLCSSATLADLYLDDFYFFSSGGILGNLLTHLVLSWLNIINATILSLFLWGLGITLFTKFSWLMLTEKIGKSIINLVKFIYLCKQCNVLLYLSRFTHCVKKNLLLIFNLNALSKNINVYTTNLDKLSIVPKPLMLTPNLKIKSSVKKKVKNNYFKCVFTKLLSSNDIMHNFLIHSNKQNTSNILLPTLNLLKLPINQSEPTDICVLRKIADLLEQYLDNYRIKVKVMGIYPGPVITRFELNLAPGIKSARVTNLSRDIARSLSVATVRVIEVIPGKPYIGIELPSKKREIIYLYEVLSSSEFCNSTSPLTMALGKDTDGNTIIVDLTVMPHLLIAGTTGSGKSISINSMIISILYKATPKEVKFIMIDPKMLELSIYEGIPHLMTKVVTDMEHANNILCNCIEIMEQRYKLMSSFGIRNIINYNKYVEKSIQEQTRLNPLCKTVKHASDNKTILEKLPYIVIIIDELADLIMVTDKKIEELIVRLAQKARAAGIHLILATQRPSVDVITGLIKASIPTRIAFTVLSKIDSRTILDQSGAESLLGMGDMLYLAPNSSLPLRVHGVYVHDEEVHAIVNFLKSNKFTKINNSLNKN